MIDKAFSIIASIVVLAIVTVVVSQRANTAGVVKSFFGGFSDSLKAAESGL